MEEKVDKRFVNTFIKRILDDTDLKRHANASFQLDHIVEHMFNNLHQCVEPDCLAFVVSDESKDHHFVRYTFRCEDCGEVCCVDHAYKHFVHTAEGNGELYWFCKGCKNFYQVKCGPFCSEEDCICRGYTTERMERYKPHMAEYDVILFHHDYGDVVNADFQTNYYKF